MNYKDLFSKLWLDYSQLNPGVNKIHRLLESEGETIVNDHIAFRTYDLPGINLEELSKTFEKYGYTKKASYFFEDKRLNAKHYEHKSDKLAPKVFISELITSDFSNFVSEVATNVASSVLKKGLKGEDLLLAKNCWAPINFSTYEKLRQESEYAAWMYAFGFRANHFTVFINHLKKYNSIEKLNSFIKAKGFILNSAGGEIKGSEHELLKQSSTLADSVAVEFSEGVRNIPCCYYEFAERFKNSSGELFNGFLEKSADKIFESTNLR